MIGRTGIASYGHLLPTGTCMAESLTGQAIQRAARWSKQAAPTGTGVPAAATPLPRVQVQTMVLTNDFPTGVPPSAPARRT